MERSPAEQEREVRNLIHRAERVPVQTSALRKDALKKLIELSRSPHQSLKKLAASNITKFFKPFPDLEEDAINAIYDLCEDQDSKVRIDGYKAIVQMSKEQPKWVKRNADVLAQLLQSDEPDEVTVVKKALAEHLDMDSKITLGVLCDQIVPIDEPVGPEDKPTRDRLRTLVLAFIAGEAKRAIVERHASQAGSEQEQLIIAGLFKTLSDPGSASDAPRIVTDILLHLPSFKGRYVLRGAELLQILLGQAEYSLKEDMNSGNNTMELALTRSFLDLAAVISVENSVANPMQLLRYYCSSLLVKDVLQRLAPVAQSFVAVHLAEALAACSRFLQPGSAETELLSSLRTQVVDGLSLLLSYISQTKPTDPREWRACETLVLAVQQRQRNTSWVLPPDLTRTLEGVNSVAQQMQQKPAVRAAELIKPLLPPRAPTPPAPAPRVAVTNDPPKAIASNRPSSVPSKRKAGNSPPSRVPPSASAPMPIRPEVAQSISIRGAHQRQSPGALRPGLADRQRSRSLTSLSTVTTAAGSSEQPSKRPRRDEGGDVSRGSSSLLNRLIPKTAGNGSGPSSLPSKPITSNRARRDVRPPEKAPSPVLGLSIKGAARAAETPPVLPHRPSSLLDRIKERDLGERMDESHYGPGASKKSKRRGRP